jgi:replicative DNA helicase
MKYSNNIQLPNNFFVEQAILNIFLTNPVVIEEEILTTLKVESFYFEPHRIIYEIICELKEKNRGITLTTIINELQDKNLLKKIGGIERIITIINKFEDIGNLEEYINILNEKYIRRLIIEIGKKIIIWGYTTSENIESILEKMEASIFSLTQEKVSQKMYTVAEIVNDVFLDLKEKIKKSQPAGLLTSFKDLDSILQGFQKSDLIILAGRPSMGKTAFSLNLAKNIVEKYEIPLLIFTLEMSRQQIIYRLLATDAEINSNRLKSGKMSAQEWKKLAQTMENFSKLPIFIDDNPNLTVLDIRSNLRKILTKKFKQGLVIIDYLQLMKLNLKLENRVQEISYITRNLKILAKEFEIPIIVLSQLSRNVDSRINKRPMLSDLRESGCLSKSLSVSSFFTNSFHSWNKTNLVNQTSLNWQFKGVKPTFVIFFENATKLTLTANHKILSKRGWIRISQLQKNDQCYLIIKKDSKQYSYRYLSIVKIEYQGIQEVYDHIIPKFHNYFVNNFVCHNSIEQDADIVIMLYREDYYKKKSLEIQPTEFIVAKHRNGPTGTATLLFKPSIASFKNLEK